MSEKLKRTTILTEKNLSESTFARNVRGESENGIIVSDWAREYAKTLLKGVEAADWVRLFSDQELENVLLLRAVMTLSLNSVDDKNLSALFAYCGLDSTNLAHWRQLLTALMNAGIKPAGAPTTLTNAFFYGLWCDIRSLLANNPKLRSNTEIAKQLLRISPFKSKYKYEVDYLRRLVGTARAKKMSDAFALSETNPLEYFAAIKAVKFGVPLDAAKDLMARYLEASRREP